MDTLATRFVRPVGQAVRSVHPAAPILTVITDPPASHDHRWIQAEGFVPIDKARSGRPRFGNVQWDEIGLAASVSGPIPSHSTIKLARH